MEQRKRKISIRKVLQVLLTIVATVGCAFAMVSASGVEDKRTLKAMPLVVVKNDRKYHTIEQKEIMDLAINRRHVDVMHIPVSKLDLKGMEQAIKQDPWVADAEVYVDVDRMMHMVVTQRVPVARLFFVDGSSCYIDTTLSTMPLADGYTYYTPVVTNVPFFSNDSAGDVLKSRIVKLVRSIATDSFWSAQVEQVVIDSVGMFELMPVLGSQRILFGDTTATAAKFSNLLGFYRNVLNRIGWDKYEQLDVRFNNQVVASPTIKFKGPVDRAIAKMNWISSIENVNAKMTKEDSAQIIEAKSQAKVAEMKAASAMSQSIGKHPTSTKDAKNNSAKEPHKTEVKKQKDKKVAETDKNKKTVPKAKETDNNTQKKQEVKQSAPKEKIKEGDKKQVKDKKEDKHKAQEHKKETTPKAAKKQEEDKKKTTVKKGDKNKQVAKPKTPEKKQEKTPKYVYPEGKKQ